jgi:hypothetical protein
VFHVEHNSVVGMVVDVGAVAAATHSAPTILILRFPPVGAGTLGVILDETPPERVSFPRKLVLRESGGQESTPPIFRNSRPEAGFPPPAFAEDKLARE